MKARSRLTLQTVLVAIIIIVAVIYALFVKPRYYAFNGGEIFFEIVSSTPFAADADYQMHAYDNQIFIGSKNGFKEVAVTGEEFWDKPFYMDNPRMVANEAYMAMVDTMGKKAFLFDQDGFLSEITTEYPILFAAVSEKGIMALVLEDGDANRVQLYSTSGKLVAERVTHFKDNGYPTAVGLSRSGELMSVAYLRPVGGKMQTDVCVFSFGEEGENHTENIMAIFSLEGTVVPDLHFLDDTHFVAVGNDRLQFYNVGTAPKLISETALKNQIEHVAYAQNGLIISYGKLMNAEADSLENQVAFYDAQGQQTAAFEPEDRISGIGCSEGMCFVRLDSGISQYKEGRRIWTYATNKDYQGFYALGKGYYLAIGHYNYEILKVKDI